MKRALWLWAPPALVAGAIFWLSSRAVPAVVAPPAGFDKLAHFGVYAILGALVCRALLGRVARPSLVWWAGLAAAVYGATDEIHQSLVPERSAELLDWLADAAGGFTGAWGWAFLARRRARRREGDG